jgi:hypothetical protein
MGARKFRLRPLHGTRGRAFGGRSAPSGRIHPVVHTDAAARWQVGSYPTQMLRSSRARYPGQPTTETLVPTPLGFVVPKPRWRQPARPPTGAFARTHAAPIGSTLCLPLAGPAGLQSSSESTGGCASGRRDREGFARGDSLTVNVDAQTNPKAKRIPTIRYVHSNRIWQILRESRRKPGRKSRTACRARQQAPVPRPRYASVSGGPQAGPRYAARRLAADAVDIKGDQPVKTQRAPGRLDAVDRALPDLSADPAGGWASCESSRGCSSRTWRTRPRAHGGGRAAEPRRLWERTSPRAADAAGPAGVWAVAAGW